jgi:hypothetical protein
MAHGKFANPFRPGAGHQPPYLAGREEEKKEFTRLLKQNEVLENMVLTGLRGVGKTVLIDTLKPIAMKAGWLWVGTDLSESTSLNEERMALRLITDLAVATSSVVINVEEIQRMGFQRKVRLEKRLDFETMGRVFKDANGLVSDKLKVVLEFVWISLQEHQPQVRGVIFAYDEAQNLADHAAKDEYPLSLLLDVFQSIQKKKIPFMLAFAGLPTLFPKLVEARTFSERMFRVLFLDRLDEADSRDAIVKPISETHCPVGISEKGIEQIVVASGGYPYFIQFICREAYDVYLQRIATDTGANVNIDEITRKLDSDFFAGRWARVTDRQRQLLQVIAQLPNYGEGEFTVQEITAASKQLLEHSFSPSHVNQMLAKLNESGLVYKNRHGKYSFAVPLLGRFIMRQLVPQN